MRTTVAAIGLCVLSCPSLGFTATGSPMAPIAKRSAETDSTAVLVARDGKEIFRYFANARQPEPIETMSMTKSFVSLAIGFLFDEGKVKLGSPVAQWFPEWKGTDKSGITVEHLLTQTSGLGASRTTEDIYRQKDFVKYALEAEVKDPPGKVFFYNNRAMNLLPGIVKKASGLPIDQYLKRKLFAPLEIEKVEWTHDGAGNPHGMSGLRLTALDLAKVGQLLADDGIWKGRRLISKKWLELSTKPSSLNGNYGLAWWLKYSEWRTEVSDEQLKIYRDAGLAPALVEELAKSQKDSKYYFGQLRGRRKDLAPAIDQLEKLWKEGKVPYPKQIPVGDPSAFSAEGSAGQELIVIAKKKLVGVRQRIKTSDSDESNPDIQFDDFSRLLIQL